MNNNPDKAVSIILPTYNGEHFIKDSIESILNQTYTNWELIIVNDCSTDNTLQIIEEYTQKDKRIKVISNAKNLKLPASLNIGFCNANGDYYTWTSDDNMYKPKAIEKMVEYLNDNPSCDLVSFNFDFITENCRFENEFTDLVLDRNMLQLTKQCNVGACFMYRKEIAVKTGDYDENMFCAEDYDYWCRIALNGNINYRDENLYKYRHNTKSLTSTKQKVIQEKTMDIRLKYAIPIMNKTGLSNDEKVKKLLGYYYNECKDKRWLEVAYNIDYLLAKKYLYKHKLKNVIRKILSVKNDDKHKIVKFFGIKLKFKRKKQRRDRKIFSRLNKEEWGRLYNKTQITSLVDSIKNNNYYVQTKALLDIIPEGSTTLEIGSGTGQSSLVLSQNKCDCTCLDFSQECLYLTEKAAQILNVNIKTVCIDATGDLPFEQKQFDYIFHSGLLEHYTKSERIAMLKHWRKYCKYMISLVPNASSLAYRIGKKIKEENGTWEYGIENPLYTQIDDFQQAGYVVCKEFTVGIEQALSFLDKNHPLKNILQNLIKNKDIQEDFMQGYLLVTIGKNLCENS